MKSRKLGIALLLLLSLVVTTGTFAYWAAGISSSSNTIDNTITIGEGETIATTVALSLNTDDSGLALVPSGKVVDALTQTESLSITFNVTVNGATTDADGLATDVSVALSQALNSDATPADVTSLFNITATPQSQTVGTADTFTVTITMNEPADVTEYNLVAGQVITLTLEFTAAAATS